MNDPFDWSHDISHIDQRQESLHTEAADHNEPESHFRDLCNYLTNMLKLWGLYLPVLHYSTQNQRLAECLMELVRMHQKDLDYRDKVQQDLAKKQFQVDMSASELKRTKAELEDFRRQLGTTENKLKAEQSRARKELEKVTAEKNLVLQARAKLQQKNNQLLHEVKKRELQCQKLKDNMRKPTEKAPLRNGIQMVGQLPAKRSTDEQLVTNNLQFLKDKYQKERELLLAESENLRAELRSYFTELAQFSAWLKQYVSEAMTQLTSDSGRRIEQHVEHLVGFNHGLLTLQLQEHIDDVKKMLMAEVDAKNCNRKAERATLPPTKRDQPLEANLENKPRQEAIKPVIQQPSMAKPRPPSNSQYQPARQKPQDVMREPSELSLIEHVSIRDFEPPIHGHGITRLPNSHWDILNDD